MGESNGENNDRGLGKSKLRNLNAKYVTEKDVFLERRKECLGAGQVRELTDVFVVGT